MKMGQKHHPFINDIALDSAIFMIFKSPTWNYTFSVMTMQKL